ncbi:hypothetical protein PMIN04_010158 [Paraphaeosphaeria minitans]
MEKRSEQDTNRSGPPSPPTPQGAPLMTAEAMLLYGSLVQQRQSPRPLQNRVPVARRRGSQNVFQLPALPRTPRIIIPREPLSEDELQRRLLLVATRLQATPDPAASASTDEADNQCGICQDKLVGSEPDAAAAIKFNHCKHALHEQCTIEWLDWVQRNRGPVHQASCPNCRRMIFPREVTRQTRPAQPQVPDSVSREIYMTFGPTLGLVRTRLHGRRNIFIRGRSPRRPILPDSRVTGPCRGSSRS